MYSKTIYIYGEHIDTKEALPDLIFQGLKKRN